MNNSSTKLSVAVLTYTDTSFVWWQKTHTHTHPIAHQRHVLHQIKTTVIHTWVINWNLCSWNIFGIFVKGSFILHCHHWMPATVLNANTIWGRSTLSYARAQLCGCVILLLLPGILHLFFIQFLTTLVIKIIEFVSAGRLPFFPGWMEGFLPV